MLHCNLIIYTGSDRYFFKPSFEYTRTLVWFDDRHQKPKVLILSGPTAIGKSRLAFEIQRSLDAALINGDATKVYRGFNLGANKSSRFHSLHLEPKDASPTMKLWNMLDFTNEEFSAGRYYDLAINEIWQAIHQGKQPVVVGGTGLYLKWLLHGKQGGPARNPKLSKLIQECLLSKASSWDDVVQYVASFDKAYSLKIQPNNYRRALRAIELHWVTGKVMSELSLQERPNHADLPLSHKQQLHPIPPSNSSQDPADDLIEQPLPLIHYSPCGAPQDIDFRCVTLHLDRHRLYDQISLRCEHMIESGLLSEVWSLMKLGLQSDSTPGKAIGYRQTMDFLNGGQFDAFSFQHYLDDFQAKSRQLAHRQLSWFRSQPEFYWIDVAAESDLKETIFKLLNLSRCEWDQLLKNQRPEDKTQADLSSKMKNYSPPFGAFRIDPKLKKQNPIEYEKQMKLKRQAMERQLRILESIKQEMQQRAEMRDTSEIESMRR